MLSLPRRPPVSGWAVRVSFLLRSWSASLDPRQGGSLAGIARELTAEGVATAQGGLRWYASTVAAVLRSAEMDGRKLSSGF
jgi:hypothetical protein